MNVNLAENALSRVDDALAITRWDASLCAEIRTAYREAVSHGVFDALTTPARVARFMEKHVWAVWDFMSLMKRVQQCLAPTTVPWVPPQSREMARLVNEIVLEEESGFVFDGKPISHFEFYLHAMRAAGADTMRIDGFVQALEDGQDWQRCLDRFAPPPAARFVRISLEIAQSQPAECIAAFTLGREQLIPEMFPLFSSQLARPDAGRDFSLFRYYLDRHVEVDGEDHGPAAQRMLEVWSGDDPAAGQAALRAVRARVDLWDSILSSVSDLPPAE